VIRSAALAEICMSLLSCFAVAPLLLENGTS
jgi:hypothetical protein